MSRTTQHLGQLAAVVLILGLALPIAPVMGQTASQLISIDSPAPGATVLNGTSITIGGWAADPAGPGTGVDAVRVYLDNPMDRGGTLLGEASYGSARADVATAHGNPAFTNSGFSYRWTPSGLSLGTHTLYVYARSVASGWANKTVEVVARAAPTPTPQPFGVYPSPGSYPVSPYPPPFWYGGLPYQSPLPCHYTFPYLYYEIMYPRYPTFPPPDGVCIMIYPPPPGC